MPKTKILENTEDVDKPDFITKERISSRARGIIFDSKDLVGNDLSNYIIQDRVKIDKDVKFSCVDGPEFDAHSIDWEELEKRNKIYEKKEKEICKLYKL